MIHAVREQVKNHLPEAELYLSPTLASPEKIHAAGYSAINFPLFHFGFNAPWQFDLSLKFPILIKLYLFLRKRVRFSGNTKLADIDLILDISGYAFAEKWGMTPVINLRSLIKEAVSNQGKYIFLPQAFGPFSENQVPVMKECISLASLVIARDGKSYSNVLKFDSNSSKIEKFPDITLSFGKKNELSTDSYCCVVPNARMLDRGGEEWKIHYEEILIEAIEDILNHSSYEVKVLNHSTYDDVALVNKLSNHFASSSRVTGVYESNPLKLKELLSRSYFNIASRFHAVASSLSSSVPCIMTSWSHKYQELAEEYQMSKYCIIQPNQPSMASLIKEVLPKDKNAMLRQKIHAANLQIEQGNIEMWQIIKHTVSNS